MSFTDIISSTLLPLLLLPLALAIIYKNYVYLLIFCAAWALIYTVEFIKHAVVKWSSHKVFLRPAGACDCTLLLAGGNVGGNPGFPSGHMASTVFVCVSLVLCSPLSSRAKNVLLLLSAVYIILMGYSRYAKACHNMTQICVGVVLGLVWAFLVKLITSRYHARAIHK
jgi:membrane-associated phospholipid phosphatase